MWTPEEKVAILSNENKNLSKQIDMVNAKIDKMSDKIDRNAEELTEKLDRNFKSFIESAAIQYASKVELDHVAREVRELNSITSRILWSLVTALVSAVCWLIAFIYLNWVK